MAEMSCFEPVLSLYFYGCFRDGVKLEFVQNLFDSKSDSIDSKVQKMFKKFDVDQFEFNTLDSTPIRGWRQII